MESTKTLVKTTCAYCGVGCGVNASVDVNAHQVEIKGDLQHPANFGRLCSKGSALGDTVGLDERLLEPEVNGETVSWDHATTYVAQELQKIIDEHGPDAVAIYGSGQLLTEDYYVANKFMKGFIGSGNMDTNSRLCMASSVVGHKRGFGSDTVPGCYEDFELADLVVLVGSNMAWCHPVTFQRLSAAKQQRPSLKVVTIDPRRTATNDVADLHLSIKSGTDAFLFNGLLAYLEQHNALNQAFIDQHTEGFEAALHSARESALSVASVAELCGIDEATVETFFSWFVSSEKAVTAYSQGINQSTSGSDKVNAILNCHFATGRIGRPGMGPFSLTGQPNAMGGREVGGLANQLAAHMGFDNAADIDRVQRFWGSPHIATKAGLVATDLFDAVHDGRVKAVWIMATNPVVSLPNADKVKAALENCPLVIASDCIAQTDTVNLAHVKLPAAGWSEKNGTVTNSERRISRQRNLFPLTGNAKPDWWIVSQVATKMGFGQSFNYQHPYQIFVEHARLSGFENNDQGHVRSFDISGLSQLDLSTYNALEPIQWPVNEKHPSGVSRLFAEGGFTTSSQKAQFLAITPRLPKAKRSAEYPLCLNTGRVRDQWHTMTRTGLSPKLNSHIAEPFVEVHPQDAQAFGLQQKHLAKVSTTWGQMVARISITENVRQGDIFVPMHWTGQLSKLGRVGPLVNPYVDPASCQPESKHTPAKIEPYNTEWHGFILSRYALNPESCEYRVTVKGEAFYRYELAGNGQHDWAAWAQSLSADRGGDKRDWLEYTDTQGVSYRGALLNPQRGIDVCFFISDHINLPERHWLSTLFVKPSLDEKELLALLTGSPPLDQPDVGRIVCACFQVGEKTINAAIRDDNLGSAIELGKKLKAGTNCGSCVPELSQLIALADPES